MSDKEKAQQELPLRFETETDAVPELKSEEPAPEVKTPGIDPGVAQRLAEVDPELLEKAEEIVERSRGPEGKLPGEK